MEGIQTKLLISQVFLYPPKICTSKLGFDFRMIVNFIVKLLTSPLLMLLGDGVTYCCCSRIVKYLKLSEIHKREVFKRVIVEGMLL